MPRSGTSKQKGRSKVAKRSLSFYLIVLVTLQVVALLAFISSVSINDFAQARRAASERASEDAEEAASLIGAAVEAAGRELTSEAALPGYSAIFADPNACTVTSGGTELFTKGEFHVLRADGTVACSSTRPAGGVVGRGYADQPWLASVPGAREPVVAGPLVDPVTKRLALIVAVPITETPGSVLRSLELSTLGHGLDAELGRRVPSSTFLVTGRDRSSVIARSTGTADGLERFSGEASIPELGWRVVAGISKAEAYEPAWLAVKEHAGFAFVVLLVVLAVAWLINRRIARPIRVLAAAVEEAAEAHSPIGVPEDGPREVRRLGRRFNRMLRERAENQIGLVEMFPSERREGGRREIDRIKSAFMMAISHEVRTPLAVISGYAELLEQQLPDLSNEEVVTIAHSVGVGAARLQRLLLDILDLERMSRGVFEAQRRPTHLAELVQRVLEMTDGHTDVRVDVPKGLVVDVDPGLTERILDNLIRNAMKHTPAGTPLWVSASCNDGDLELVVEDAGPGIPDDLKSEVFEPFTQGDTPEHDPGTGVGLSLVAQFARLHKGRVWVDDRPGGGARFHVTLAQAKRKSRPVKKAS